MTLSLADRARRGLAIAAIPPYLRVAIVAENASFRFGGESSLPLHYFARLRERKIDAWLVVHGRTLPELEALFPSELDRILAIPDNWLHKLLWKPHSFLPHRVYGPTFGLLIELYNQYLQRKIVKSLIARHGVNVVHQPTPVSPKAPSFLAYLGVPVVMGPMNGGMDYPAAFRTEESRSARMTVAFGRSSANFINRLIPGKKNADILLVANERTRLALPACVGGGVVYLPENGVDLAIWTFAQDVRSGKMARFLFIGRLVDWKRLDLVLRALTTVPDATLQVIGDGDMRQTWSDLAIELGISSRVKFSGWLSQPECAVVLRDATALLLPSIFECGGAVVLEAMAVGTPVIATRWGGPADYLDESCGILVDPANVRTLVDGFAEGMRKLIEYPEVRAKLGSNGRRRVEEQYDWEKKVDRMLEIYAQAVQNAGGRPAKAGS